MTNIDDVAQTLAEYERLAITSGARVQIDPPEFSADGTNWVPVWLAPEPPLAGRATVHRDGIPTTVYATWGESLPVDTSLTEDGRRWCDIWDAKPMQRFGSFLVRSALRRAFREVIGDRVEPDEDAPRATADAAPGQDWDKAIADARTVEAVHTLHQEMKTARAVTVPRERALRAKINELTADWTPLDEHAADAASERPAVQDHLPPANRAARRKAARKKGARR
ncbi:hypothetical protein CQ047_11260 [Microbacterium sp. MYb72]|uniref:hypothetical protein n=1 Tax=Microbacterium sp. MYb72 TaxID=1848693 RepID=UPI000CFE1160|nr:hypothetical protein [Microbacterium sp. MYb72]PRB09249.1 hypothetical protein CQ047_11260 [Microbacterium sp. MYb72]